MSRRELVRIAAGILAGLALASLPFLQYGVRTHHHRAAAGPDAHHAHHHHRHGGTHP